MSETLAPTSTGCPRNLTSLSVPAARVNPMKSQDFHLLFTIWGASSRSFVPIWELVREKLTVGAFLSAQGNRSSTRRNRVFSARAEAEDA